MDMHDVRRTRLRDTIENVIEDALSAGVDGDEFRKMLADAWEDVARERAKRDVKALLGEVR